MKLHRLACLVVLLVPLLALPSLHAAAPFSPKTSVTIQGDQFHLNGRPTYAGRTWKGKKIEGLLMNSRMVQGVFDDLNPETVSRWAYPDTGKWDAERNTREFLAAMPVWRAHGLLAFTINFQGGSPEGYSRNQPWINSAFRPAASACSPKSPATAANTTRAHRRGEVQEWASQWVIRTVAGASPLPWIGPADQSSRGQDGPAT